MTCPKCKMDTLEYYHTDNNCKQERGHICSACGYKLPDSVLSIDYNRWSAEVVMEWEYIPEKTTAYIERCECGDEITKYHRNGPYYKTSGKEIMPFCPVDKWHPLTDWNQLKMVIKEMREMGYSLYISIPLKGWGIPYWGTDEVVADFQIQANKDEQPRSFEAADIDLPTAVLQAAHEALKGENE